MWADKKMKLNKSKIHKSYSKSNYCKNLATYLGEQVQVDVKYVSNECIDFASCHSIYYQIAAIDEYPRKRYMELVKENSTYTTSSFLKQLLESFKRYSPRYNNISGKVLNFKTPMR